MAEPSQALSSLIRSNFTKEDAQSIFEGYQLITKLQNKGEGRVRRKDGVSFNPIHCRIASILVNEGKVKDVKTIIDSFTVSNDIDLFLGSRELNSDQLKIMAQAVLIDDLRHLHMTDYTQDEKTDRIKWIMKDRISLIEFASPLTPFLTTALNHARKRCEV